MKRWWPLAVPLLALMATMLPVILQGEFWAPGDAITQTYPQRMAAAQALARGDFPFWDPYLFGGMPWLATIHMGFLSPLNWPGTCLGMAASADLTMLLGYLVQMGGMLAFTRTLGLPPAAGAVAALAFPLGGFLTTYTGGPQMHQAAAFAPWLLAAIERHATHGGRAAVAGMALAVLGMLLAGHPQVAGYGLIVAALYALMRGGGVRAVATRAGAFALGLGLAMVQLVPTLDLIATSQRRAIDYAWLTAGSPPPHALVTALFPTVFGCRTPSWLHPVPLWSDHVWLGCTEGYVGPVAWLLALVALARWRERAICFWAAVAATGLVLSLGSHTPLYRLWAALPLVSQMPYPSRHGYEVTLAVAVLAAYGMAHLLDAPTEARRALARASLALGTAMAGVWAVLLAFGPGFAARTQPFLDHTPWAPPGLQLAAVLAPTQPGFWLPPLLLAAAWATARWQPALLTLLLAADLWSFGYHQGATSELPSRPADLVVAPRPDPNAGRTLTLTAKRYPYLPGQDPLGLLRREHYPDASMLAGEATINGYDAFLPARYGKLTGMDSFGHAGEHDASVWDAPHHAFDLLGLRTLRLEPDVATQPAWQARLAGERWRRLPDEAGLVVTANPRALPAAWRVARVRAVPAAAVDDAVAGRAPFDPRAEALVEPPATATAVTPGPATLTAPSINTLALHTDGAGAGLVVVSSGYDAGWRAFGARGEELAVVRADALLLGVAVPPGPQDITLRYRPPRWTLAWGLSLATLLLGLALALVPRRASST